MNHVSRYGGKVFDEETILAEANECIRGQIAHFRCHKMLDQVALFKNAGENFLLDISAVLKYEVNSLLPWSCLLDFYDTLLM